MSALEFRSVTLRREPGGPVVLSNLTFSIKPSERVALLGLNGSGKTTLLQSVVGLVPHEGEIFVGGSQISPATLPTTRENIGFLFNVPEDQLLFPEVLEDAAFGLLKKGGPRNEALTETRQMLSTLGVANLASSPVYHLSHGEKQRVALAGALVTRPALLLLDEPTSGLDPPGKAKLGTLLAQHGAAMLVATHDLDFASRLCTRFLLLEQGRIVFDEPDCQAIRTRWGME